MWFLSVKLVVLPSPEHLFLLRYSVAKDLIALISYYRTTKMRSFWNKENNSFLNYPFWRIDTWPKLEVFTRSRHKPRENVHARATIGLCFTSDWLKRWSENFEPITEWRNAKPKQFANYFRRSIENRSIWKVHFIKFSKGRFCTLKLQGTPLF